MGDFLIHYNHNHDPDNGRFTFGSGGSSRSDKKRKRQQKVANWVTLNKDGVAAYKSQKRMQQELDVLYYDMIEDLAINIALENGRSADNVTDVDWYEAQEMVDRKLGRNKK